MHRWLARALEAFAQRQLFKQYRIKTWDVQPEQLPESAFKKPAEPAGWKISMANTSLPLQRSFGALAGLGDQLGQSFLRDWPA